MKEKAELFRPIYIIQIVASLLIVSLTLLQGGNVFLMALVIWVLALVATLIRLRYAEHDVEQYLAHMGEAIASIQSEAMTEFPFPVMVVKSGGEIIWYNGFCKQTILQERDFFGRSFAEIVPEVNLWEPCPAGGKNVLVSGHYFTMYYLSETKEKDSMTIIYFLDDHELKYFANEYYETRPAVMLMMIDNSDELFQGLKENERGRIVSQVETALEKYVEENGGLLRKLERDRYLAVVEERRMREMVAGRFSLLDEVRAISTGDRIPPTISVGVGRDAKNFHEAEVAARQSLDMALGRGGDQAAVKTKTGYEFYGGVSKGVAKRSKVRSRIVAAALSELIQSSENVMIMGHRFGDLDSLGAAVGMCRAVTLMDKPAYIAVDAVHSLATPLLESLMENGFRDHFLTPAQALQQVTKTTLLIIVDTHIVNIVESKELYQACRNVVVIDHHRKMVGHIENAVLFYHEPFASSASEMVTELIQYLGDGKKVGVAESEALLAGIMLDTKNFTIRTGVRTFEAAAFLRLMGADTVRVRKFFVSTMDSYQQKTRLVSNAEVYRSCAVATTDAKGDEVRVVAAQAADELLTISGVEASFVIYEIENGVSVSARSMGSVNVQLIMEQLGGGGHHTMAGAQLPEKSLDDVRQMLLEAIESYFSNQRTP